MPVEFGGTAVEGIDISLSPSVELAGVVRVNGQAPVSVADVSVFLEPKEMNFRGGGYVDRVKEDGGVTLRGLGPFSYQLNVNNTPENCYLEAAKVGDQDALENGLDLSVAGGTLEVVLNPQGAQLDGVVRNAK